MDHYYYTYNIHFTLDRVNAKAFSIIILPHLKLYYHYVSIRLQNVFSVFVSLHNSLPAIPYLPESENGTPEELLDSVSQAVKDFVGKAPQFDDLTMLCLEYRGANKE